MLRHDRLERGDLHAAGSDQHPGRFITGDKRVDLVQTFAVDDLQAYYESLTVLGPTLRQSPTGMGPEIAVVLDGICSNLI
ncbi:hypothetical protein GCM10009715_01810 [Paeniglutamicibacter psychrophenolicus]